MFGFDWYVRTWALPIWNQEHLSRTGATALSFPIYSCHFSTFATSSNLQLPPLSQYHSNQSPIYSHLRQAAHPEMAANEGLHKGPGTVIRRRRIEWPPLNPQLLETIQLANESIPNPFPPSLAQTIQLIQTEAAKCEPDWRHPADLWIFDYCKPKFPMRKRTEFIGNFLTTLYWRV